jgi:hypothetical protein
MKNSSCSWVTIKYQDRLFDVRLSNHKGIEEIRAVDSEIDIAPILNKKTIRSIQLIISKSNHNSTLGEHHAI